MIRAFAADRADRLYCLAILLVFAPLHLQVGRTSGTIDGFGRVPSRYATAGRRGSDEFPPKWRLQAMKLKTPVVIVRHSRRMLYAGLFLTIASTASLANDNCQRLEELDRQYAGVTLTSDQQQLKRKLVAWYHKNCGSTRRVASRR